jgi:hypothetical protein
MKEKRNPIIEEDDSCLTAAEPTTSCAMRSDSPFNKNGVFDYPGDYDPGIGPYGLKEMNTRIDKTELDRTNPKKWIRVDDFMAEMQKIYLF